MDQRSKIAILGYGVEGRSMFNYLLKHNYPNITICDQNVNLKDEMPQGVSVRLGPDHLKDLTDFDVIFRTPGIRYHSPEIQAAVLKGVEVTSVIKFFIDQCPCPVIGVSGTKGKGTTTTLIYKILKQAGKDAYIGGNIGNAPTDFLDDLTPESFAVLELSCCQLQDMEKSPRYAVLLNTTSDHLDYYNDNSEYMAAKEHLLSHQTANSVAVLNKDYEYSKYYAPLTKGKVFYISKWDSVDRGAYVKDNSIWYADENERQEIIEISKIKLIGSHNLENVMPATVISRALNIPVAHIREVIETFSGLPHRLELVRELKGIRFYNDSFSTNPGTSMAAVDSFDEPTVLIAGGSDKGLSYDEWAEKILTKESLKTVVLIGVTADKMESSLEDAEKKLGTAIGSPTKILRRESFEDAILTAYSEAEPNGVVVLSPAAASFDMFKDYKDRGEKFKKFVQAL